MLAAAPGAGRVVSALWLCLCCPVNCASTSGSALLQAGKMTRHSLVVPDEGGGSGSSLIGAADRALVPSPSPGGGALEAAPCYQRSLEVQPPAGLWHIHVLYDDSKLAASNGTAAVEALVSDAREQLNVHFRKGGTKDSEYLHMSHTMYSLFPRSTKVSEIVGWLHPRLGSLTAFVHPFSGCFKSDHLVWGYFIGADRFSKADITPTSRWPICRYKGC